MTGNPYISYKKTHVETADKGTLLLMLYDGAVRFLVEGKKQMEEGNYSEAFRALGRSDRIVKELIASLDVEKGGELAANLFRLYEFVLWKIFLAERERKTSHIDEALHIIEELRAAWKEAVGRQKKAVKKEVSPKPEKGKEQVSVSVVG